MSITGSSRILNIFSALSSLNPLLLLLPFARLRLHLLYYDFNLVHHLLLCRRLCIFSFTMFESTQRLFDQIAAEKRIAEWKRTSTTSTTTPAPPAVFHEDADLSVTNEISDESSNVSLDQSNNGFSFVSILHWASFSTGLYSVLAVLVALALVTGCCYFRGRH